LVPFNTKIEPNGMNIGMNEKPHIEPDKTILNFALIFRTDLQTFERIRNFLLKSGAELVYQTKSVEKIIV
jgi:hypothetical protein